jgi:competence protein ComEC
VVQFRLDLRMILARLGRFAPEPLARFVILKLIAFALAAWEILLISALMQIALVLPMAVYFHRATLTALPANILVVPLTEILMPASVAALGLSYLSSSGGSIPPAPRAALYLPARRAAFESAWPTSMPVTSSFPGWICGLAGRRRTARLRRPVIMN